MRILGLVLLLLARVEAHVPRQDASVSVPSGDGTAAVMAPLPTETVVMNSQSRHRRPSPAKLLPLVIDDDLEIAANTTVSHHSRLQLTPGSSARGPTAGATARSTFLVIARDSASAYSAQSGLNDYGIPFETLLVPGTGADLPVLNSSATVGNYGGIVVLSEVSYGNSDGLYESALTDDQWEQMYDYQTNFGVRMVRLDVVPSSSTGTVTIGDCCASDVEQIVTINDTSTFPTAGLVQGAQLSSTGLYHYAGIITDNSIATAFATFAPNPDFDYQGTSVAAIINNFGTRQQMVFFLAFATDWSETSNILQHAWITWATRGLYAGYRRAMLNTQVDDMFLTSPIFYPPGAAFRVSPTDLEQHISWMKDINARLPAGSNYTVEIGYNGNGNIGVMTCGSDCGDVSVPTVLSPSTRPTRSSTSKFSGVATTITSTMSPTSKSSSVSISSTPNIITITVTSSRQDSTTSTSTPTLSRSTKTRSTSTGRTTITAPNAYVRDVSPASFNPEAKTTSNKACNPGPITYPSQPEPSALEWVKPPGIGVNLWPATATNYPFSVSCLILDPLENWWSDPAHLDAFSHVSHTFTHESEDNATYYDVTREISWNQAWLKQVGIYNATNFSPSGLIPPAITGLHNGDALRAWWDNGIRYVVGDNTRPALLNLDNEHWPLITSVENDNFDGIQITPRWATNIYYNCDTTDCDVREWYAISQGQGTIEDLLELEKSTNSRHLLALHHDAFMFHQANMRWQGVGTTVVNGIPQQLSLLQMWVETMVAEYTRLVTWPIVSLKHDDLAVAFMNRMTRDACNYTLTWNMDTAARTINSVTVGSTNNVCAAPIPLTVPGGVLSTQGYMTEQLGNDPLTIWVPLTGQSASFTLTTPIPW